MNHWQGVAGGEDHFEANARAGQIIAITTVLTGMGQITVTVNTILKIQQ